MVKGKNSTNGGPGSCTMAATAVGVTGEWRSGPSKEECEYTAKAEQEGRRREEGISTIISYGSGGEPFNRGMGR
jgi:hypothetical protein